MAKSKQYTGKDIKSLSDREHVRLRTQIYLGSTNPITYPIPFFNDTFEVQDIEFIPAVYKAVGEILDNCIDEFAQINQKSKVLTINANASEGKYQISDNGRGIPIDKHETGKYTPEVALGTLRAGRNFGEENEAGVIGQNGVGSACVNFCSSNFDVLINRDGQKYSQKFRDGGDRASRPSIRKGPTKTGTQVSFVLDKEVFKDTSLPESLIRNRAIEIAFTNPGVQVKHNGESFKFKRGLEDMVKSVSDNYFRFDLDGMEFFVVFDVHNAIDERMFTWVNSSLLFDGGLCNTQFLNAFCEATIQQLKTAAKKEKCTVTRNDVRANLLVFGSMKVANPEYDAQSKTRLTGPNLLKEMKDLVAKGWKSFARRNKPWLEEVLERASDRHNLSANKKAAKDMAKQSKKKIAGLMDATSKARFECQVLITEGKSAASMISDVRDSKTTASFPLTGKVNNVHSSSIAQLMKMTKVTDLLASIGLIPGVKANPRDLRYGKIIIATDADVDGSDIFTLLINLFYQFWPELFDPHYEPVVYRLLAPNVVAAKGTKRVHFASRSDYEKVKDKYKGYEIKYYKGLGSMKREDWKMILSGETDTLIPIVEDEQFKQTLDLLFGPDANARKLWLQE